MSRPTALWHPKHWAVWAAIGVLVALTHLPYKVQLALGKGVGLLLHKVANSRRRIAEVNVELCFPERSADEQAALVRQIFIDNAIGLFETFIARFHCCEVIARLIIADAFFPTAFAFFALVVPREFVRFGF